MRRLRSFSFGGHDFADMLLVSGISRSIAPGRRIETVEAPGMDGAHVRVAGLEPLEISLTCRIARMDAEGMAFARRRLAELLCGDEPRDLVLPDEPDKRMKAVYQGGGELSRLFAWPEAELSFLCPDPVAYGRRRSASVDGSADIVVGGTHPARPVVTARPPKAAYWQITNVGTGEFVRVDAPFTGSQTLVVDMALQRCTVNGIDARPAVESDFFSISGRASLAVSGGAASIEWDERWL